jgi:hypothetical protein
MPPLDATYPDAEAPPSTQIRYSPLASVGGWYWLLGKQQKAASQSAPANERPSSPGLRLRRLRRFGRGVMLWVFFWYAAFQMGATFLKDRWHRIGPYYELQKWPALERLVAEEPDRPLLVMMGSSRTAWAFQASALDGTPDSDGRPMLVYNFGIPSTGPCSQLFYLRDMLAKGIRPRFLLIEFLPPLLCEVGRGVVSEESLLPFESLSLRRMLQWMPYLHRPRKGAHLWVQARLAPCYTLRNHVVAELTSLATGSPMPKHIPIDNRGWHLSLPSIAPLLHEIRLAEARAGYLPGLANFHLGKAPYRAIHELLDLCRHEKIPSALVLMPEDSCVRSWYSPQAKTTIHNLLDELRQTYGVECIDAQCWLPDYDFEDGHHALLGGALTFTRRIRAELPRLLTQSSETMKSD